MTSTLVLVLVGAVIVASPVARGARDVAALVGAGVARWRARRRWSRALDVALVRAVRGA